MDKALEAGARVTPEMIAAAWQAWHARHGGKLGPGPGFVEAITAALSVASALPATDTSGLVERLLASSDMELHGPTGEWAGGGHPAPPPPPLALTGFGGVGGGAGGGQPLVSPLDSLHVPVPCIRDLPVVRAVAIDLQRHVNVAADRTLRDSQAVKAGFAQ